MILDLLKSVVAGMLLHACAAFAFGPHDAEALAVPHAADLSTIAAPQSCLLPPLESPGHAAALSTQPDSGTRS